MAAVSFLVPDYDTAIAFFCDGLDFRLCEDLPQGHKRWITVEPPGGGLRLVLARADNHEQRAMIGRQGGGKVWLFLTTDEFTRDHARLIRAGVVFEEAPRHEIYGTVAVWRDPWGNRWDLIQPSRPTTGPK